jgi:hypothetical protein
VVLDHEQPGRESDESIVGNVVIASMAMVVSLLIATVVYVLMYIRSWEDLGILTNRDEFITLMIGPCLFAFLCMYLPYVLKCRPPGASKGIGTPSKT